jgi:carbon monoxide dehydrogenase subunit G
MNNFESRDGRVNVNEEVIFKFVTDIRNFERFIPGDKVKNWHATKELCSFEVPYAGKTGFNIAQKIPYSEVDYCGKGMNTDFTFKIWILKDIDNKSIVKIIIGAEINPVLKMMVSKPLEEFLEKLISEMEQFAEWEKTIE